MIDVLPFRWLTDLQNDGLINQFMMAVMTTLPVLNLGMLLGWLSPMTPQLQDPNGPAPEPITDDTLSWMASVTFLPAIFCSVLVGSLADRWGRKILLLLCSLMLVISWMIVLISLRPWALILSRAVASLSCAIAYIITPLYLKEIASDNVRGAIGALFNLFQNFGYVVIYVAGAYMDFYPASWLCLSIPVLHLVAFPFMPETPVFLVKQGKIQEAKNALAWLRNKEKDDKTIEETVKKLEEEESQANSMQKPTWKSLVTNKTRFKAFRIAVTVMVCQETCGFLIVLLYASSIFEVASKSIDMNLTPNEQAIFVGVIQLLGSIVTSSIIEKTGRKRLLASASLITGLSMLMLGVWFYVTSMGFWLPGWVPLLALCLCIFMVAAGYQPVPYILTCELFAFQYRGMVNSFVTTMDATSDFVQTKAFDPLQKLIGIHWVFIIFSIVCFTASLYTIFNVPETKGKTVEEIYALLEDKPKKMKKKDIENEVGDSKF